MPEDERWYPTGQSQSSPLARVSSRVGDAPVVVGEGARGGGGRRADEQAANPTPVAVAVPRHQRMSPRQN